MVDHDLIDLKESLQFHIGEICKKANTKRATTSEPKLQPSATNCLTELLFNYTSRSLAMDLTAFSEHGKRKTVTVDDVLLAARKHKRTTAKLENFKQLLKKEK